ncbi:MAG TPA: hypothetical protein VGH90_13400 [Chthoniobacteraceae bacterium]|jgi:hypothetical protein
MGGELSGPELLRRIRWITAIFIVGLVLSGITAFPLGSELELLGRILQIDPALDVSHYHGLQFWIAKVWEALRYEAAHYPFLAYGTDWLAFGHLVISLFFFPAWRDPVRYRGVYQCGLVACGGVFALALICGPIRGIPLYWRLIDCSFGFFGALPLLYVLRLTSRLERLGSTPRRDTLTA